MRSRFTYSIVLLLILAIVFVILFIKPDAAFLYQNTKGDCSGRSQFMYHKIFRSIDTNEVVFFGSSRTMNDVNDSVLTAAGNKRFLNLGYCRYGRNLDTYFAEVYLARHNPNILVLEVRAEEGSSAHPVSPFIMPASSLAEECYMLQEEVFNHAYNKWLCNLKYVRSILWSQKTKDLRHQKFTYGHWPRLESLKANELNKKRLQDSLDIQTHKQLNRSSAYYINKVKRLCLLKGIKLYFIYLPSYGNLTKLPLEFSDYKSIGKVLIPPDTIMKNALNFSDKDHLNESGSIKLSKWLSKQFD